ncbi:TIGR01212 family radical SAM protein [Geofilum rubicundum]|uniref:Predicted Fe-S oxidoreductase n=1 Tax=Geofilum rubicundum JCM 15548 TaxID=1236989 RepID=A0A0E9LTT2_9BACT|nr:TIGR01212 family radical SAM protein [Geofilum rubicundum]GAO28669.1 predicted Fe-S oxidoreductase [Geofilum rubicundum JCM 15548]
MTFPWGHDQRYNDFGRYMRQRFKGRVQKLSLNAGFTCPNRDGSKGTGGCSFCNNDTFKPAYCQPIMSVSDQIRKGIDLFRVRYPDIRFLAYFQAYTNTYAELSQLKKLYEEALAIPDVMGLIVGTRPDCLPEPLLDYFEELQKRVYVTVELGIESTKDLTLERVNRGHDFACTQDAVSRLADRNILVGAHLILGLPGETREDMLTHADKLSQLPIHYLKVHQLQYVRGSVMGQDYLNHPEKYQVFELEAYLDLVVDFIERVRPDIVLERFASQAPFELLLAPKWGVKNFEVSRMVEKRLAERNSWQGKLWKQAP